MSPDESVGVNKSVWLVITNLKKIVTDDNRSVGLRCPFERCMSHQKNPLEVQRGKRVHKNVYGYGCSCGERSMRSRINMMNGPVYDFVVLMVHMYMVREKRHESARKTTQPRTYVKVLTSVKNQKR